MWSLVERLPARLRDLDDDMKAVIGFALDRGAARFGLDRDGDVLVLRGGSRQRQAMRQERDRLQKRRMNGIDRYRMEAAGVHGQCIIVADVYDVAVALRDPVLGPQAMEALRCVWLTAEDMPEAGMDACYCCGKGWTWERVPRLCLLLHVSLPETSLLTFACEACANDHGRLTAGLDMLAA